MTNIAVLDHLRIAVGATAADAVNDSLDLARACEDLGYARYWIAEHHYVANMACWAPSVLIARIAAATKTMRVGAAGVLLNFHSPQQTAADFSMLAAMFPARIDLGVARAPGGSPQTLAALLDGNAVKDNFPRRIERLQQALKTMSADTRARAADQPQLWTLGSNDQSARYAGHHGMPYASAHFLTGEKSVRALQTYRGAFKPSKACAVPTTAIAVFALAAATDGLAAGMASSFLLSMIKEQRGEDGRIAAPEDPAAFCRTDAERALAESWRQRMIVGNPQRVCQRLQQIADSAQADTVAILTATHRPADRLESYRLIAKAFGKSGQ